MEQRISIERMEQAVNLFGSFDENVRLIESEFKVTISNRPDLCEYQCNGNKHLRRDKRAQNEQNEYRAKKRRQSDAPEFIRITHGDAPPELFFHFTTSRRAMC